MGGHPDFFFRSMHADVCCFFCWNGLWRQLILQCAPFAPMLLLTPRSLKNLVHDKFGSNHQNPENDMLKLYLDIYIYIHYFKSCLIYYCTCAHRSPMVFRCFSVSVLSGRRIQMLGLGRTCTWSLYWRPETSQWQNPKRTGLEIRVWKSAWLFVFCNIRIGSDWFEVSLGLNGYSFTFRAPMKHQMVTTSSWMKRSLRCWMLSHLRKDKAEHGARQKETKS